MKCTIPEISWHNRDPVLSVDIQPINAEKNGGIYRLASGGTDSHVLIWYMTLNENGSVNLDLAADLARHQRAVNAVKWSPNGELLASGDDESVIFIWKLKGESEQVNIVDTTNEQDKEIWITMKILRGHMEDVYDLSWSLNSQFLISGSVDNSAMIWDVYKGKSTAILSEHKGFVQGVAWDPQNQYVATLSTDRYLRIYDIQTKKVLHRSSKCTLPVPEGSELHGKIVRIYHDDTLQTFFRRLTFTPDGKLLIVPAGVVDYDGVDKPLHTTYIYSRYSLKQPSIVLPSPDQYTIAVKCCPNLFKLRPHKESNPPVIPLPYRMIFAVASKSSVYLYDTQQKMPFGIISNIHYTRLTDLTWSKDARILIISSTDGFCSLVTFAEGELGEFYTEEESKQENDNNLEVKNNNTKSKNESIIPPQKKASPEKNVNVEETKILSAQNKENSQNELNGNKTDNNDCEMKDIETQSVCENNKNVDACGSIKQSSGEKLEKNGLKDKMSEDHVIILSEEDEKSLDDTKEKKEQNGSNSELNADKILNIVKIEQEQKQDTTHSIEEINLVSKNTERDSSEKRETTNFNEELKTKDTDKVSVDSTFEENHEDNQENKSANEIDENKEQKRKGEKHGTPNELAETNDSPSNNDNNSESKAANKTKGLNWIEVRRKPRNPVETVSKSNSSST